MAPLRFRRRRFFEVAPLKNSTYAVTVRDGTSTPTVITFADEAEAKAWILAQKQADIAAAYPYYRTKGRADDQAP
jgi:hypothetical protein